MNTLTLPRRTCRLLPPSGKVSYPRLALTSGKATDLYALLPLESGWGRAWRLVKADGEAYDVLLDGEEGSLCDCMGYLAHGHCKHVSSLRALCLAGKL